MHTDTFANRSNSKKPGVPTAGWHMPGLKTTTVYVGADTTNLGKEFHNFAALKEKKLRLTISRDWYVLKKLEFMTSGSTCCTQCKIIIWMNQPHSID